MVAHSSPRSSASVLIVATAAVAAAVPHEVIAGLLDRHAARNWRDLNTEDRAANDSDHTHAEGRLFSSYDTADHHRAVPRGLLSPQIQLSAEGWRSCQPACPGSRSVQGLTQVAPLRSATLARCWLHRGAVVVSFAIPAMAHLLFPFCGCWCSARRPTPPGLPQISRGQENSLAQTPRDK